MSTLVAADIGGTHARFAIASINAGRVETLGEPITLETAKYDGFEAARAELARHHRQPLPRDCAIAAAGPIRDGVVKLTNAAWTIDASALRDRLKFEHVTLLNDFEAVAHAIAQCEPHALRHVTGPDRPLPDHGTISIIGPGTGLGIAQLRRDAAGYHVQATEGGHAGFAPLDRFEDRLLARIRAREAHCPRERVVSGTALSDLYALVAEDEGQTARIIDNKALWALAISGDDPLARAALERLCMSLGSIAGDVVLTQGGFAGVVIAGGIGLRLAEILPRSGFGVRFRAKGPYEELMASIPVKLITHPQPGLFGAAAAFAMEHR